MKERIEAFRLDDPSAVLPFSSRLAREQGWTHAETARVIREYRRFLCLAALSGHPVSPSDAVDHAWHLHLLYTRSYWQELCKETLGFDLHHEPARGNTEDAGKFADWYARTLESYRHLFGETPPADIWPSPEAKAAKRRRRQSKRWIDPARHWIIPKWPALGRARSPFS